MSEPDHEAIVEARRERLAEVRARRGDAYDDRRRDR